LITLMMSRDKMPNLNNIKKLISETFTGLSIKKIALLGKGKAGTIYLVNGEIVFKIPLQNEGEIARWQKNEAVVSRFLEGKLEIETPKILYAASECGLYIIGESLLSGIPLSYELCDTYDKETKHDIQRQIGKIVRQLHDIGGNDYSWTGENPETPTECIAEFNEKFRAETAALFSPEEREQVEEIATHYKKISAEAPVPFVLCHHDLHFGNFMFDAKSKQITGLLDFGCAGYAEPARDWHYYFNAKYVLEGYGSTNDKYFSDRQKFHALSHLLDNLNEEIQEKKPHTSLDFIKKYILRGETD